MSDLESVASISFALANLGAEPTPKGVFIFQLLISVAKVAPSLELKSFARCQIKARLGRTLPERQRCTENITQEDVVSEVRQFLVFVALIL